MHVRRLLQGRFTVLAVCDNRNVCTLIDFFEGLGANLEKDSAHMLELLDRVSLQGPPHNTDISHQIDGEIWEFIKGRLRVFWFYDEGRVVVCTHGLVKKGQKTPKADIAQANSRRKEYLAAKRAGRLEIEEDE